MSNLLDPTYTRSDLNNTVDLLARMNKSLYVTNGHAVGAPDEAIFGFVPRLVSAGKLAAQGNLSTDKGILSESASSKDIYCTIITVYDKAVVYGEIQCNSNLNCGLGTLFGDIVDVEYAQISTSPTVQRMPQQLANLAGSFYNLSTLNASTTVWNMSQQLANLAQSFYNLSTLNVSTTVWNMSQQSGNLAQS